MKILFVLLFCYQNCFANVINEIKKDYLKDREKNVNDYKNDAKAMKEKYKNGKDKFLIEFENGKKKNEKWYYESGQIKYETKYNNDIKNGEEKVFFANGQLKEKNVYENDKVKEQTLYYENGHKEAEIKDNKEIWYYEDGKIDTDSSIKKDLTFILPINGAVLTSKYGIRIDPVKKFFIASHKGIDYSAPKGTQFHATNDGIVEKAEWHMDFGNMVVIKHNENYKTRYAHAENLFVKKGDIVKTGYPLGVIGATGKATGIHLHYEVLYNNIAINPDKVTKIAKDDDVYYKKNN